MNHHEAEFSQYLERGIVDEVGGMIATGKEASVWFAVSHGRRLAIKLYKNSSHRSFKNRSDYFMQTIAPHRREARAIKNGTYFGRRLEECLWHSREVRMLRLLRSAGADVPEVLAVGERSFVMEYYETDGKAAPRLSDLRSKLLYRDRILERILWNMKVFLENGVVHADLSPYNILHPSPERIVIIDFPQAVELKMSDRTIELLKRDIHNVAAFFRRRGSNCEEEKIFNMLVDEKDEEYYRI